MTTADQHLVRQPDGMTDGRQLWNQPTEIPDATEHRSAYRGHSISSGAWFRSRVPALPSVERVLSRHILCNASQDARDFVWP